MPDLADGESVEMKGSGSKPYVLKNVGGVYSCTCPAWRNQSIGIERRTCKHLRKLRGDAAEEARLGGPAPVPARKVRSGDEDADGPPVLLAMPWDKVLDPKGWWLSEKLDGVRAWWDGKQFLSRVGNRFLAPDWFVAGLPDFPLDGEIWMARKQFQRTVGIVKREDRSDHWRELRFVVFDAPTQTSLFEERLTFVADLLKRQQPPYATALPHDRCLGLEHLRSELARVEGLGGEGLMLRQPQSKYEAGRSTTLLKIKSFIDAEARVVGHQAGAGRHKGRLGALLVELADGTPFGVGTGFSDAERDHPPPIGSIICFRYQELTEAGVPRFPSYVGLRDDVPFEPTPLAATPPTPAPAAAPIPTPAPAAPIPTPAASATPASGKRYFECVEGTSSKFWEVWVSGADLTTRWGRLGTPGQTRTKTFASASAAQAEADKLVASKVDGGYKAI
jgi:DNA ligase 1